LAPAERLVALVVGDPIFARKPIQRTAARTRDLVVRGERTIFSLNGSAPARLPGTRSEAAVIAHLYGSEPLTGESATEAALRQRIGEADVIHLATHGYLLPLRPMSSGVLLTVPRKEPAIGNTENDGVLQAWEIRSELKLRAEVVVLSACETGLGENVAAEGIVGMTRALQYAGARSIVASQWKVPDESTRMLMMAFHRKLREGMAKDEALRQAMVAVRSKAGMGHPYYWAAFCLSGDPDNPNLGTVHSAGKRTGRR
jgi:CHAT domain-containing protein